MFIYTHVFRALKELKTDVICFRSKQCSLINETEVQNCFQ